MSRKVTRTTRTGSPEPDEEESEEEDYGELFQGIDDSVYIHGGDAEDNGDFDPDYDPLDEALYEVEGD